MTEPLEYLRSHDDGGAPASPRRYRIPARHATALIVLLAVVAGALGSTGIVLSILAVRKTNQQAEAAYLAQVETFSTRRANTRDTCIEDERFKAELRALVRALGVDPDQFPRSPYTGQRILAPIGRDVVTACERESRRKVPESNRPRRDARSQEGAGRGQDTEGEA